MLEGAASWGERSEPQKHRHYPKLWGTLPSSALGCGHPKLAGACSSLPPCGCPPKEAVGCNQHHGSTPPRLGLHPPWGAGWGWGGVTHPRSPSPAGVGRAQGAGAGRKCRGGTAAMATETSPAPACAWGRGGCRATHPAVTLTRCHRTPVAPYPAATAPQHGGVRGVAWVRGLWHRVSHPVSAGTHGDGEPLVTWGHPTATSTHPELSSHPGGFHTQVSPSRQPKLGAPLWAPPAKHPLFGSRYPGHPRVLDWGVPVWVLGQIGVPGGGCQEMAAWMGVMDGGGGQAGAPR